MDNLHLSPEFQMSLLLFVALGGVARGHFLPGVTVTPPVEEITGGERGEETPSLSPCFFRPSPRS